MEVISLLTLSYINHALCELTVDIRCCRGAKSTNLVQTARADAEWRKQGQKWPGRPSDMAISMHSIEMRPYIHFNSIFGYLPLFWTIKVV